MSKLNELIEALESNIMDGDHATVAEQACELIEIVKKQSELLQTCEEFIASDPNCGPQGVGLITMIQDI